MNLAEHYKDWIGSIVGYITKRYPTLASLCILVIWVMASQIMYEQAALSPGDGVLHYIMVMLAVGLILIIGPMVISTIIALILTMIDGLNEELKTITGNNKKTIVYTTKHSIGLTKEQEVFLKKLVKMIKREYTEYSLDRFTLLPGQIMNQWIIYIEHILENNSYEPRDKEWLNEAKYLYQRLQKRHTHELMLKLSKSGNNKKTI